MVKGQSHGMEWNGMSNSTPVKNGLIPAGAQMMVMMMMSAWFVNDGCDFVKFV